jgi:hypothetical protein
VTVLRALVPLLVLSALLAVVPAASAGPTSGPVCQNVASGPDYVLFLCVDPGASCRVYTVTYGHEGERSTHCVLA